MHLDRPTYRNCARRLSYALRTPHTLLVLACLIGACGSPSGSDSGIPQADADVFDAGDGDAADSGTPQLLTDVAVGALSTCVLGAAGVASCWGSTEFGALGVDPVEADRCVLASDGGREIPCLTSPSASPFTGAESVHLGGTFGCALVDGEVSCTGWGLGGLLGPGMPETVHDPVPIDLPTPVVSLATGFAHACAIAGTPAGVHCWGLDSFGMAGVAADEADVCTTSTGDAPCLVRPHRLDLPGPVGIAVGFRHSCAVDSSGAVYCWGANEVGELGRGGAYDLFDHPELMPVMDLSDAEEVVAGSGFSCARTGGGQIVCWGRGDFGQLGVGQPVEELSMACHQGALCTTAPRVVGVMPATAIYAGSAHACALVAGAPWCWGSASHGQTGILAADATLCMRVPLFEDVPCRPVPTALSLGEGVEKMALGLQHSCVLQAGTVRCWGGNEAGQLGTGTSGPPSAVPVTITVPD